jgi:serine/threonine-protein kinase
MAAPQLAGYTINHEFASGGMAKIYDATQISLNRPVAIKFLSKNLMAHPEAQTLFERESLIIAQLNHPNIVQVIDKGITSSSQPYFVMEKIVGIDLSQMLSGGELPLAKKLDIAIQLCKGLSYAHKNNVIHRDIKPSNIIIDQHGQVKILDFGIAIANEGNSDEQEKTSVLGTQGYVSPEQQEDYSNATIASDIYSVGIVFYDLFGRKAENKSKRCDSRLKDIPSELVALIQKCSHPLVNERYQSLNNVRDDLLKISQGSHLGQNFFQEVQKENKDLSQKFNLLDILEKEPNKRVYLFQKKRNRQLLVIKRMSAEMDGFKEAQYLTSLKHPNIANIFAAIKDEKSITIISEYLSGGSLTNQLIQNISEYDFLEQSSQICSAIYFAHQNSLVHGNLSPHNILFDSYKTVKLTDFAQENTSKEIKKYQPQGHEKLSEAYDIYSMGAIFHHMLYGAPPGDSLPQPTRKVSFRLAKLIQKMLSLDPYTRPIAAEVLMELQRILSKTENPNKRSEESSSEKEIIYLQQKEKSKTVAQKKPIGLIIALTISVLCNISLATNLVMLYLGK